MAKQDWRSDIDEAFVALMALVDDGYEFPDATAKVLSKYTGVDVDELRKRYDNDDRC